MENTTPDIRLVADAGSTKTDWAAARGGETLCRCATQGITPVHQSAGQIDEIIDKELMPQLTERLHETGFSLNQISIVSFYGAGCRGASAETVAAVLAKHFPHCCGITVGNDLLAAARAVCGKNEGIACILGTGANSCLYDGREIVMNTPPMGYILGDEGSGAVLGKLFLNGIFKGTLPAAIRDEFLKDTRQDIDTVIKKVYREPMANRYLASMSPFIHKHLDCKEIEELVIGNFTDFFIRNIDRYGRKDLPVGAVGSVAFHYREQFAEAARRCGYTLGKIVAHPIDALLNFHTQNLYLS